MNTRTNRFEKSDSDIALPTNIVELVNSIEGVDRMVLSSQSLRGALMPKLVVSHDTGDTIGVIIIPPFATEPPILHVYLSIRLRSMLETDELVLEP